MLQTIRMAFRARLVKLRITGTLTFFISIVDANEAVRDAWVSLWVSRLKEVSLKSEEEIGIKSHMQSHYSQN